MGLMQLGAAALLAVLGLFCAEAEAASSRGAECFEYGYDYNGYDVQQIPFVATPSVCMEECAASRGCAFWTYDTSSRVCYLKSAGAFTERRPSSKMVSGPRQCTFSPYCFEVGVDYYGHDIDKLEGRYIMTPMDCQRLCTGNPQCAFFSWKFSTHSCFLKSSSAFMSRREDPDVTSGPRVCSNSGIPAPPHPSDYPTPFDPSTAPPPCVEPGVEYRGYTVRTTKTKSAAACQASCQQLRDCSFWTWSGSNRACALKSGEATNGRTENQTTLDKVSGARDCIPVLPGCHYANVGIIGARLSTRSASSFDICQIYCASYAGCTHFSHDLLNRECTLWSSFNAYSQGTSTQGLISGPAFCDAQETCFEQSDYVGHNVDENETGEIASPAACQALCRKHADCHYWTWLRSNKGCYLKDENAVLGKANDITALGRFSGPKWCTVSSGCKTLNAIYTGSMYHQEETDDYKACSSSCKTSPFCTAWTYHSDLGFCSLFSGAVALANMPVRGAVSGDKECIEDKPDDDSCFEEGILYNLDDVAACLLHTGMNNQVTDALNTDECYAACQRHSSCTYWSFKNGEQCYLLKHKEQPGFVFDPNSTSGPKLCSDSLTFYSEGYTFDKPPLATAHTYTLSACMNKCTMTPQCHYWVFKKGGVDSNCLLFDKTAGPYRTQDPDSFYGELLPTSLVATGCTFRNVLGSIVIADPTSCQQECKVNPLCNAWQVAPDASQPAGVPLVKCTLFKKGDAPIKVRDPNTKCGTRIAPGQVEVGKAAADLKDGTAVSDASSLEDCAKACQLDSKCKMWQWKAFECTVFKKKEDLVDATDAVIGRIDLLSFKSLTVNMAYSNTPEQETPGTGSPRLASGFRRRFTARLSSPQQTPNDCVKACSDDPACLAWTFKDNSCSLFSNAARLTTDDTAISGTRATPPLPCEALSPKPLSVPFYVSPIVADAATPDKSVCLSACLSGDIQFNKSFQSEAAQEWHSNPGSSALPGSPAARKRSALSDEPSPKTPVECALLASSEKCWSFKPATDGTGWVCIEHRRCDVVIDSEGSVSGEKIMKDENSSASGTPGDTVDKETEDTPEDEEDADDSGEEDPDADSDTRR